MPRDGFQQELGRLVEEAIGLGWEVEACLENTTRAIETTDVGSASPVLGVDARYKERGNEIDEWCAVLQARQAPVARDLRVVLSVRAVTDHLVRAGTLCEHACRAVVEAAGDTAADTGRPAPGLRVRLSEMAHATREVFRGGVEVFEARDDERARALKDADDVVDLLYSEIMALAFGGEDLVGAHGRCARAALTARYLERIADHGVGIGESTIFLVTGRRAGTATRG